MTRIPGVAIGGVFADRYELVEELGRGGFGVVYRARQLGLGREVAIKVLFPPGDLGQAEQLRARFEREAVLVSQLSHPHTIRQYDFGESAEGVMYFVMEYLRGKTLEDILEDDGPMSVPRIAAVARGVLKSLSEAHAAGIVHRDLKPANIMLCDVHGESDFAKVLDFGIAKTTMGNHDITSAGLALGSPRYMAPELLRGEALTPAADLYSLGLTLAECLTGRPVIATDHAITQAQLQLQPGPLEFDPLVEASVLWPWLQGAVDKDKTRRFQSAEAMLAALDHIPVDDGAPPEPLTLPLQSISLASLAPPRSAPSSPTPAPAPAPTPAPVDDDSTVRIDGVAVFAEVQKLRATLPPGQMFDPSMLGNTLDHAVSPLSPSPDPTPAPGSSPVATPPAAAHVDDDETLPSMSIDREHYARIGQQLAQSRSGDAAAPTPMFLNPPLDTTGVTSNSGLLNVTPGSGLLNVKPNPPAPAAAPSSTTPLAAPSPTTPPSGKGGISDRARTLAMVGGIVVVILITLAIARLVL